MSRRRTLMELHGRRGCTILTAEQNVNSGLEAAGRSAVAKQGSPIRATDAIPARLVDELVPRGVAVAV